MSSSAKPVLGTAGSIYVTRVSDGKVVDRIDLADLSGVTVRDDGQMIPKEQITSETVFNTFHDALYSGGRYRAVHYTPLRATDKGLEIKLHSGVLDYGTEYKVTVDAGVIQGLSNAWETTFKTRARPETTSELKVNPNGEGDFCTINGALKFASSLGKSEAVTILVAPGTYPEMLYLRDKENVTIKGTGKRSQSVIAYANNESYENGSGGALTAKPATGKKIGTSGGRALFLVENCNNLTLENLTIRNTFGELKGQAETIYFNSGSNAHRLNIENCELWSFQDTFLCKGLVYVHKSLIAGHCDYVWGYPKACLFEDCEIRSLADGYIVQARIQGAGDKGFVFLNCRLTAGSGVQDGKVYLARSGGDSNYYDNVTFIGCTMYPIISSQGWYNSPRPNPSMPNATSGWKEYGSKDSSGNPIYGHNSYGIYLTDDTAKAFSSKEAVLGI